MTSRQRLLGFIAGAAALTGLVACGDSFRGPDYTPPAVTPAIAPTPLPPDVATIYKFRTDVGGVAHECIAYDGGNDGGIFCATIRPGA